MGYVYPALWSKRIFVAYAASESHDDSAALGSLRLFVVLTKNSMREKVISQECSCQSQKITSAIHPA